MHSAASVAYPVARSRRMGLWLAAFCVCGATPVGVWAATVPVPAWIRAGVLLWTAGAAAFAAACWWRTAACSLVWDGQDWRCERFERGVEVVDLPQARVTVSIDLQSLMLLRLVPPSGRAHWLLVDRASAPLRWHALRCAVTATAFSPAEPSVERLAP